MTKASITAQTVLAFLSIFILVLSACGASPLPALTATTSPSPAFTATVPQPSTATPIVTPTLALPTATQTPLPQAKRPQYLLQANFNYNRHALAVNETIDYPNATGQALSEMLVQVEPNNHAGAFKLTALQTADQKITDFTLQSNQLKFNLPAPVPAGQSLKLAISYELYLPVIPAVPSTTVRSVIFGYSERQANLVDWYPTIPPYQQGKGWVIHNPWFYGEHTLYEMSDFQVDIGLVDPPANLTIAGASPATISGGHYSYTHSNARNFTFSASTMYTTYVKMVGDIQVTSYVFPFDAPAGRTALNDCAQALELYSRLFGAYPHASLSVVEADFHDGMEYDGLYFLSKAFYSTYDGTPKGYLTAIGVHETAHQWWYARVANDQALEPWLDESMATYSELLYYSQISNDLAKWWWSYRVDYFNPAGWVNLHIYDYTGSYPYRDGVYLRGARFLDQVRQKIGDEAFFAFIKDYASKEQGKISTEQDFFDILSQHSSADLSDIKKAYFKPQS
jgi:hypothetical protein